MNESAIINKSKKINLKKYYSNKSSCPSNKDNLKMKKTQSDKKSLPRQYITPLNLMCSNSNKTKKNDLNDLVFNNSLIPKGTFDEGIMNIFYQMIDSMKLIRSTINMSQELSNDNSIKSIKMNKKPLVEFVLEPLVELVLEPRDYELINLDLITELPNEYPTEFNEFCLNNNLNPPNRTTGNGKALSVILKYMYCYWNRDVCDKFVEKFNIVTKDSIQLFNKHNQWGIQTNSGTERGKLYIVYPYCLSNKHKMRKNVKFDGTEEEKNNEIDKIKSTISSIELR